MKNWRPEMANRMSEAYRQLSYEIIKKVRIYVVGKYIVRLHQSFLMKKNKRQTYMKYEPTVSRFLNHDKKVWETHILSRLKTHREFASIV